MAEDNPVAPAEIQYVEPDLLVDPCPECGQRIAHCQGPFYTRVWTPSHHMHFMRAGSCTLWPACLGEMRSRSPEKLTGGGQLILGRRPEGLRELRFPASSPEAASMQGHYGVPGVAARGGWVVWWVKPSDVLLAREGDEAKRVSTEVRRVGYLKIDDATSNAAGECRACYGKVLWGDSDLGKRVPLEPETLQVSTREGYYVGSVHWDHCVKKADGSPRRQPRRVRDRARTGEKDED